MGLKYKPGDYVIVDETKWSHLNFTSKPVKGTIDKDNRINLDVPAGGVGSLVTWLYYGSDECIKGKVEETMGKTVEFMDLKVGDRVALKGDHNGLKLKDMPIVGTVISADGSGKRVTLDKAGTMYGRSTDELTIFDCCLADNQSAAQTTKEGELRTGDVVYVNHNAFLLKGCTFTKYPLIARIDTSYNPKDEYVNVTTVRENRKLIIRNEDILGYRHDLDTFKPGERVIIDHTTWGFRDPDAKERVYASVVDGCTNSSRVGELRLEKPRTDKSYVLGDDRYQIFAGQTDDVFHLYGTSHAQVEGEKVMGKAVRVVLSQDTVNQIIEDLEELQGDYRYDRGEETDTVLGALRACVESDQAPIFNPDLDDWYSDSIIDADKVLEFAKNPLLQYFRRDD